jgi:phosphoglycolate phosphatase-like HAD superfamily hydrolase
MTSRPLVLFDIDGTLVRRAGPHHRQALVHGVRKVTGLETTTEGVPVHGMLDPDILTVMMQRAGAPRRLIRQSLPAIYRSAEAYYLHHAPDLSRKTCPGARAVLDRLMRRGVILGLVTGNLTRIGWRKLDRAGLRAFFRFGAFGEMGVTRAALAKLAMREARRRGWIDPRSPVSLIGDAPSDVLAAQSNRIRSIAVHTGISTRDELRLLGPDILLASLRELRLDMIADGALRRPD